MQLWDPKKGPIGQPESFTHSASNHTHLQNTHLLYLSKKLCSSEDLASYKKESTANMLFFFEENKNKQNAYFFPDDPNV